MRIITGSAKGRKLKMPKGGKTRPAMDMVKGATFNILMGNIADNKFLDLFAGSGSLGIEALSRGAQLAHFVDYSRECANTIKHNLQLTGLSENAEVFCMDCMKFLKMPNQNIYDVVFIDPPYSKGLIQPIVDSIEESQMFDENTIFIIERVKHDEIVIDKTNGLTMTDERFFGDTVLTFFKKG